MGEASAILNRGCQGFIQKPFTLKSFSEKLREIQFLFRLNVAAFQASSWAETPGPDLTLNKSGG
jgi:hypothetical protein